MGWARIAITGEGYVPLKGVDVECFDVDTLFPIAVVETDLGGIALFTGLPDDQRYFFKARSRRTSTGVESTLDPDRHRTYTGLVRLQILAHSGAVCADALVDPNDLWGTHTTIQAAIDDFAGLANTTITILIMPGTYNEALTIPNNETTSYIFQTCRHLLPGAEGEKTGAAAIGSPVVTINGGSSPALTYSGGSTSNPISLHGIHFTSSSADGTLRLDEGTIRVSECTMENTGSGDTITAVFTSVTSLLVLENCYIKAGVGNLTLSTSGGVRAYNTIFAEGVSVTTIGDGESVVFSGCSIYATTDPALNLGGSWSTDHYRVENCRILQSTSGADGIMLKGSFAAGDCGLQAWLIVGNEIRGTAGAGSVGVLVTGQAGAKSVVATVVGNAIVNWENGVVFVDGGCSLALGNTYSDITTDDVVNNSVPTSELGHAILDSALHTDSVAQGVTRGSIIYGNTSSPSKWDELVIGAADTVFHSDGTDPSWTGSPSLSGTLTVDTINEFTGDAGLTIESNYFEDAHAAFGGGVSAISTADVMRLAETFSGDLGATAYRGFWIDVTYDPNAATTGFHTAFRIDFDIAAGNAQSFTNTRGILSLIRLRGAGAKTTNQALSAGVITAESNTVAVDMIMCGLGGDAAIGTGSTVTGIWGLAVNDLGVSSNDVTGDIRAIEVLDQTGATSATNLTGIRIGALSGASTIIGIHQVSRTNEHNRLVADTMIGIDETPSYILHVKNVTDQLMRLESTAGGNVGARLDFFHNSPSAAAFDVIGVQYFYGLDDAGTPNIIDFAHMTATAVDISEGSVDGQFAWYTRIAGADTLVMYIRAGQLRCDVTGPSAGIRIGGDTQWYRSAANVWRTPDAVIIDGTLTVSGAIILNVTTITSNATLTTSQTVVLCDASSGAITVTLPAASGNDGRHYHIKKIDSSGNAVMIDGNGSETVDGETTQVIAVQYNSIQIVCDGSAWHIL